MPPRKIPRWAIDLPYYTGMWFVVLTGFGIFPLTSPLRMWPLFLVCSALCGVAEYKMLEHFAYRNAARKNRQR